MRARSTCRRCDGVLGRLDTAEDQERGAHQLCAGLTDKDWLALRPWFTGQLTGVQMGGE